MTITPGHRCPQHDSGLSMRCDCGTEPAAATVALDAEEQAVMDHILAAMQGLKDMGLRANEGELVPAVHVLQSFVIQHMLERLDDPEKPCWGHWYGLREASDA